MLSIKNAKIFDGEKFLPEKTIYILNGKIIDIKSSKRNIAVKNEINAKGNILACGFIDIQVNGGGGAFFNEETTVDSVKKISETHLKQGTTSVLPTIITDSSEKILLALKVVEQCIQNKIPGILGIHIEGPFINIEKKGIHAAEYIRIPTQNEINIIKNNRRGIVLMTLAPEKTEPNIIEEFVKNNIIVFAGHTNATYEQMINAYEIGVTGVTHLFNACSQLGSREPGVVGAALLHKNSWCGIIVDGIHVSYNTLKLAFLAKNINKFILVSDAMSAVGTNNKSFYIGHTEIFVKESMYVDSNGTLAGSSLTIHKALQNLIENKLANIPEALKMSSTNAAECLGIDRKNKYSSLKGRIANGFDADLVLLNKSTLKIEHIFQKGNQVL